MPKTPEDLVEQALIATGARAAGLWRMEGRALVQVVFRAGEGLPELVASQFASATSTVPLDRTGLGIVAAAVGGAPAVSHVDRLPHENGSGYWLKAFEAERSVAIPLDFEGRPREILSVAVPAGAPPTGEIIRTLRSCVSEPAAAG